MSYKRKAILKSEPNELQEKSYSGNLIWGNIRVTESKAIDIFLISTLRQKMFWAKV